MGEDPLEGERRFRQVIERSAEARREARWSRRWARPLRQAPRLMLLLLALVCLGGFLIIVFGVAVKWTEAYACSLAEARRSSVVVAELGEPVEAGLFAWGNWEKGTVTEAAFSTKLSGPKGEGTLRVQLYSSPLGSSLRMELEKDGQTRQVYNGPSHCR